MENHDGFADFVSAVLTTAAEALDTEAVVGLLVSLTEERERNHRLAAKIDEERVSYNGMLAEYERRVVSLESAVEDSRRECYVANDNTDFWKSRSNELADRMKAEVQPLLVGDPLVMAARVYRDASGEPTSRKLTAIKALREVTSLGLRESKLAVEQVIKIMEMKEAAN